MENGGPDWNRTSDTLLFRQVTTMSSLVFPTVISRSLKPVRAVLFYLNYQLEIKRFRVFLSRYSVVRDRSSFLSLTVSLY